MKWTANIELRRKGNGTSGAGGPTALDATTIRDCVSPSLQVKERRHRAQASSSVAVAERPALKVLDQNTNDDPALRHKDASEQELLEAARSGDERAFGELIDRCVAQVRRRILRMVRNQQDTEDVLQDSLLRAYLHLDQFRGDSTFSSWLHRIAINSAMMLLRKRKVHAVISLDRHEDDPSSWDAWDVPDHSPNPEQIYTKRQVLEGLSNAVEHLPSFFRGVINEFYDGGCSVQETADAVGISVAATKSRLVRAKAHIAFGAEGKASVSPRLSISSQRIAKRERPIERR